MTFSCSNLVQQIVESSCMPANYFASCTEYSHFHNDYRFIAKKIKYMGTKRCRKIWVHFKHGIKHWVLLPVSKKDSHSENEHTMHLFRILHWQSQKLILPPFNAFTHLKEWLFSQTCCSVQMLEVKKKLVEAALLGVFWLAHGHHIFREELQFSDPVMLRLWAHVEIPKQRHSRLVYQKTTNVVRELRIGPLLPCIVLASHDGCHGSHKDSALGFACTPESCHTVGPLRSYTVWQIARAAPAELIHRSHHQKVLYPPIFPESGVQHVGPMRSAFCCVSALKIDIQRAWNDRSILEFMLLEAAKNGK